MVPTVSSCTCTYLLPVPVDRYGTVRYLGIIVREMSRARKMNAAPCSPMRRTPESCVSPVLRTPQSHAMTLRYLGHRRLQYRILLFKGITLQYLGHRGENFECEYLLKKIVKIRNCPRTYLLGPGRAVR